jgi:CubicO group peptidase (beta-lactamase class C family)
MVMRKIYITGLILKGLLFIVFYFWDLAISSSGNTSMNTVLRSEQFQPIQFRIKNELSDMEEFEQLESGLINLLGKYNIKGASIAIARDGRLIYAKGLGYADLEEEELVEPRHQFRIASASKLITATTILKMSESGLLDIDDNVFGSNGILSDSIYLVFKDRRINNITVRHLLNHSSGWNNRHGDYMFMPHLIASSLNIELPVQVPDIIRFALRQPLHFEPGSRTSYSNLGYAILGEIIEKISGMNYEDYVKETILDPLGIYDMRIGKNLETDRYKNEVKYYGLPNAVKVNSFHTTNKIVPIIYGGNDLQALGASGGWITSPLEYLKLIVAIDGCEIVPDILSPESIELMTNPSLSGGHTIGWAGTDGNGNWWRTGTLSGTSVLAMRQNNGLSWAVFFNSSTVKGISFPREIRHEVQTALNSIEDWPEHDLFYYFETPPFLYPDIAALN